MKPAICETPFDVGRYSTPGEAEGRGRQTFNVGSSFLIPKKCRTQSNPVKAHQSKTKGHNPRTMEYAGDHRSIGRNSASDQARLSPAKSGTTPPRCVTGRSANILNSALFNFLLPKSYFLNLLFLLTLAFAFTCKADHLPRKWTNSLGVTMEATLVSTDASRVTLLLNSGRIITIEISKLSKPDQDYLDNWQKEQSVGGVAPVATPVPQPETTPRSAQTQATTAAAPPSSEASIPTQPRQQANLLLDPALWRRGRSPDPSVQPKAELYLTFPELGMSRSANEPMAMHIRIPENYRPDRPVPVIVWLAGGDGTSWYHEASELVDQRDFVMVGMNYPLSVPEPRYSSPQGQIGRIWEIQEKMLVKLVQMIPNLDPKLRVVAGFSNGAHTIGGCLGQREQSFYGFFNVFVLIEGGASSSFNYPALPGRSFYIAWGNGKDGDGDDFGLKLVDAAKKARMNVESHTMEGVGHDFPASEEQKVKGWLRTVVIPNLDPDI